MSSRRKFIRRAILTSMGIACLSPSKAFFKSKKVGLQMSTVQNLLKADVYGTLSEIAKIGYDEVECRKLPGLDAKQTQQALKDAGLQSSCSMILMQDVKDKTTTASTIEEALVMNKKFLTMAWIPAKTIDDFKRTAQKFNEIGEEFSKAGISFCHHNHAFEFEKTEGQIPYDILLNETDPEFVNFEMDLYWVTKGGQQPVNYLKNNPGRFPLWHVKDMDNTSERAITEVGRGIIDFQEIFEYRKLAGLKHYFVEQETPAPDKLWSIKVSHETVNKLKF